MASYGYGPPPPAPPVAVGSNSAHGYASYGQYQQPLSASLGIHSARGGRGGHGGRGDYHNAAPTYAFNGQQPAPAYTAMAPQAPPQQPPQAPLPAQNYHPNYAPQIYQQPQYPQQPYHPSQHQQPQQYGQQYPPHAQHLGGHHQQTPPPTQQQQWTGPSLPLHLQPSSLAQTQAQAPPSGGPQFGAGRGRGGHHGDRSGQKNATAAMGPPIRMGFDNRQDQLAPVSIGYPAQPYGPPQAQAPYAPAPPYQTYPPSGPPSMGAPAHYDPYLTGQAAVPRPHGRSGYHNNSGGFKGRAHSGGDKLRHGHNQHHHHSNNNNVHSNTNVPRKQPGGGPSTPHNNHTSHQKPDAASAGKKKKRKTNTLGLTPGEASDDDADEEVKLVELIGPDAPNPTDIAAWIAERRANYPTQARAKAKTAADGAAIGGDRARGPGRDVAASSLEKQKLKAEKLRKQLEKVESSIKRKREQQDEGDDMRDITVSTSASSDSKSDSEKPDVLPSRPAPVAFLPPPAKKADPSKHCKYFSTGGICGKKGKCRFVHDEAVRAAALKERELNGGRMTLQQRLILNDKDQEDLTIVRTLQYLKEKGMMAESQHMPEPPAPWAEQRPHVPKAAAHFALPPLPPTAQSDRYHGWDLSGFGNRDL